MSQRHWSQEVTLHYLGNLDFKMCRCTNDWLENAEEEEQHRYDMAINLLRALMFIIHAQRNNYNYVFDEETGEVDFLA